MHLYIMTRGIKKDSDQFITELQGKYLPFKFPDPKNPKELMPCNLQLGVRPIRLYEVVFPEDSKDIVLSTILGTEGVWKDGKSQHKKHQKWIWSIRKILGCEPIPKYKTDLVLPISKQNVEVVGIGIKKDYWQDAKDEKRYNHKKNDTCFEGI